MTEKRIPHTDLDRLLDRLRGLGAVHAPTRDESGDVILAEVSPGKPVVLDYKNFPLSPKVFLLPQTQTLLRFTNGKPHEPAPVAGNGGPSQGDGRPPNRQAFLFGVRPCDARALLALDEVFLGGDQRDPYYERLRAKTVVIVLACTRPMSSCFCTSVGGGPSDEAGADVLAIGLEADLLLRAITPKGEDLLSSAADLLGDATPPAIEEAQERARKAADQIAPVELDRSAERLRNAYDSPLWGILSQKCLGCGTCSFLCPTCHCFDITDEVRGDVVRRVRTWDCCAYPLFTLHASGHNPRPTPKERWRQRLMHKFRYAVENLGRLFCVGCGRCIRNCPVSLDLRAVFRELGA